MDVPEDLDRPENRAGAAPTLPVAEPGSGAGGHLDRRRILGAAIAVIDRDGLRALTMRAVGAYLGVEGMALYHYLPGREALLDGVVETVIDELYGDPDVHLTSPDWQEYLSGWPTGSVGSPSLTPRCFR